MNDPTSPPPTAPHREFLGVGEPPPQWQPPPPVEPEEERFRPWATWLLMGVCALVFGLEGPDSGQDASARMVGLGVNLSTLTLHGQAWRLWSSTFMHLNAAHLTVNMLSLYNVGPTMERLLGRPRFLALYALTGLAGSVVSCLTHRTTPAMSLGASGAIFGMAAALGVWLSTSQDWQEAPKAREAGHEMMGLLGLNLVYGLMTPGIDNSCHLGGIVGGVTGLFLLRKAADRGWFATVSSEIWLWAVGALPLVIEAVVLLRFVLAS